MLPALVCAAVLAQTAEPKIRVAVPALTVLNLDDKLGDFYASHLAQQLSYRGVGTITSSEIAALLGFERQRQLLGCPDDSCKADVLQRLGVDGLLVGRVTKLDKSYQLDVRIISPGDARPLAAASANTEDQDRLVGVFTVVAAQLANELSQKLNRQLGPQGGVEVVLQPSKVKRRSWAPLVAGVVSFGIGGALLGLARGAYNDLITPRTFDMAYDQATADAIASRGQTYQTVGWVMVGVGGACVVAAAAMFLLGGNDTVQAGVALTPSGGSIAVSGRWP